MGLLAYQQLEEEFSDFVHSDFAVACNTGTAALHLGLLALGVKPGDEVIVPDFTMAACAFAVSYCGATPVFVDVEPTTYGINPDLIEQAITEKTKAIMVVHVYGRLANMEKILEIAHKHNLPVIEDASEAHGAVLGSRADVTCYSLYKNKIIHAEEGGIVTTDNYDIDARIRFLKNMAFTPEHDYFHPEIGFNYRMSDSQALLALDSLHKYAENALIRRFNEGCYDSLLPINLPRRDAIWFYEYPGKTVNMELGARHSFKPLSSLPMYGSGAGLAVSRELSETLILLPVGPDITLKTIYQLSHELNEQ